jgi:hypothetical protein
VDSVTNNEKVVRIMVATTTFRDVHPKLSWPST